MLGSGSHIASWWRFAHYASERRGIPSITSGGGTVSALYLPAGRTGITHLRISPAL
jgi:hypothetical protein